jgi:heme exporter protein C
MTPAPSTASRATRLLGAATLAGFAVLLWLGLVVSPADRVQGDAVRLMYVHVPAAWLAYLAFAITAFSSAMWLWTRTRSPIWDRLAVTTAEIGVVFTGLCLVTGMVWGRITWGVYWTWDARLTTTALLFVLFLGYLAIRRATLDPQVRAKRAAIAGLIAFVDVPIVHWSVRWWNTLHQEATVARTDLNPTIDGMMLFTLFVGVVVFTLAFAWMAVHRYRIAYLEDAEEAHGLEVALEERWAEGQAQVSAAGVVR